MTPSTRPGPLAAALVVAAMQFAPAADDPVLAASERALVDGQPLQAVQLLRGHAGLARPGRERLTLARAYLALGRGEDALAALGAGADAAWTVQWPAELRGAAAQCGGEAAAACGDAAVARTLLEVACRASGAGVAIDRCLALLGELCVRLGDDAAATAYLRVLWNDWPRSSYRGHGGALLAMRLAAGDPDQARGVLAGVRLCDGLANGDRLVAAELLCRLLVERHPGQCLVVAEQERERLRAGGGEAGRLPLYHALALAALDPRAALAELNALPGPLAAEPAAHEALSRLQGRAPAVGDPRLIVEHARAEAELGRVAAARALLEPLAAGDPAALAALVELPGVDPLAYLGSAAARQPLAALGLGRALVAAGHQREAWPLLRELLAASDAGRATDVPQAAALYWAGQAAQSADHAACAQLRGRLLGLTGQGTEIGLAWCEEAERRAAAGQDAEPAWERAAGALPADHPWQAPAAWRAARALVEAGTRLADARRLVEAPAWRGSAPDQLRCRFLLVQVAERLGDRPAALAAAQSLLPAADAAQAERLGVIIARLQDGSGANPR